MTESIMLKKSKAFALRIVRLYKYLRTELIKMLTASIKTAKAE